MIIIRPVTHRDGKSLLRLAEKASVGITSLPKNQDALDQRIALSLDSFEQSIASPGQELYVLVMEDQETKEIVGCAAIKASVGKTAPFYSYKYSNLTQASHALNCRFEMGLLTLVNDYQGAAELMSLYVNPTMRSTGLGKLLSLSRFLLMADNRERFSETIIAELRGMSDASGHSPFWSHIGEHFFKMDFATADHMTGLGQKDFIADLMPKHPIYTCLLPKAAQEVIGVAHPSSQAAQKILQAQGFQYHHYVDIFDAGPVIEAPLSSIHAIKHSTVYCIAKITKNIDQNKQYIIARTNPPFRACMGAIHVIEDNTCHMPQNIARALQVNVGDTMRSYFW